MIDLGSGYSARWIGWHPQRDINPQYKDIPDIEKAMLMITCPHGESAIRPDTPEVRRIFPNGPFWTVESWEPLTLSPSIASRSCSCHGFIREGKWVSA